MKTTVAFVVSSTGGHLYPALRVAREMTAAGWDRERIIFIGPDTELSRKIITQAGFVYKALPTTGLTYGFSWTAFKRLWQLGASFSRAGRILEEQKCRVVFSLGSYSALPVTWSARRRRIPLVIFESNAKPGKINLLTSRWAEKIAVVWPQTARFFPAERTVVTGLPLRQDFFKISPEQARAYWGIPPQKKVVLVFGGSQGSAVVNRVCLEMAPQLLADSETILIQISGPNEFSKVKQRAEEIGLGWRNLAPGAGGGANYLLTAYCAEMPRAILAADLVISRSGALAVGEIAAAGKRAILVPFGSSAGGHQDANAAALAEAGQARVIGEGELSSGRLLIEARWLFSRRPVAAGASRQWADSAGRLADIIRELAQNG